MAKPTKIHFISMGVRCCGNYYEPNDSAKTNKKSKYCIVMAHGLAGVKEMRLDAYAEMFSKSGYRVLVFDYRHFGESDGLPRQLLDIKSQHQDWLSAVEYVVNEKNVTMEGIILWGSSLSGGHVMEIASKLPSIAAVISQVPHVNGIASAMATDTLTSLRLTGLAIRDYIGSLLGKPPVYVSASGQPGELALMTAAGEAHGYSSLVPEKLKFDQRVAARFVLQMSQYNPGRRLKELTMPTLVQVGLKDVTTPPKATIKYANKATSATLKTYDLGHFEPYVEPAFSKFVADQISFLDKVTNSSPDTLD